MENNLRALFCLRIDELVAKKKICIVNGSTGWRLSLIDDMLNLNRDLLFHIFNEIR